MTRRNQTGFLVFILTGSQTNIRKIFSITFKNEQICFTKRHLCIHNGRSFYVQNKRELYFFHFINVKRLTVFKYV